MNRFQIALKAAAQLGLQKTALYAHYQLGLKSGWIQLLTPANRAAPKAVWLKPSGDFPLSIPDLNALGYPSSDLLDEANTILNGNFHRFGAEETTPIDLIPPSPLTHWTRTNDNPRSDEDIKFIWEPARFGWVFPLGRAYLLQRDDKYAAAFWQQAETFWAANPPNLGPNWASGQEVALRILAFTFALQVFHDSQSTTPTRHQRLLGSIVEHAQRIPPTIHYARAQNNNHLITEAVGLYTAGCLLPHHPQAARWRKLGWRWFTWAVLHQIDPDGTYVQQSVNYHRLMLQAALWMNAQSRKVNQPLPEPVNKRLMAATSWLYANFDHTSGRAPNLGHNDGAHILPLASGTFADYRPTIQAAACAFLGGPLLPPGPWDETTLWIGLNPYVKSLPRLTLTPTVLRLDDAETNSWGSVRAVRYEDRPAQADQLHVELWWQGINIACDPGTYRYTAPPPWNNGLARTGVHNTIMVDNQEQMIRAGRFLWLDWAQAHVSPQDGAEPSITAEHNGYHRLGVTHRRTLACLPAKGWLVTDALLPLNPQAAHTMHEGILHWLLPDLPWQITENQLTLQTPAGQVTLKISAFSGQERLTESIQIIRAGEIVHGAPANLPTHGWISPAYAYKKPALSILASLTAHLPVQFLSEWQLFPKKELPSANVNREC